MGQNSHFRYAGIWLLGFPFFSLLAGLGGHYLWPPLPAVDIDRLPAVAEWEALPVADLAPFVGELPKYKLDGFEDRFPSCLSDEDIIKGHLSIKPPTIDRQKCRLSSGLWIDGWTGRRIEDPSRVVVVETIPVRWATAAALAAGHVPESWAVDWFRLTPINAGRFLPLTPERAGKRTGPIDQQRPFRQSVSCLYAGHWALVKIRYQLAVSPGERKVVSHLLRKCRSTQGLSSPVAEVTSK
ncbi:MAG: hypothetical protein OXH65_03100 [Paracoccaceae bacterium]|nr:hypothetical protein [Paracoccaceae bacterium]